MSWERDALDDIRGTYKESLHYLIEALFDRIGMLSERVRSLETYRDAAAQCVHLTKDEAVALQNKLAELDERTVGLVK